VSQQTIGRDIATLSTVDNVKTDRGTDTLGRNRSTKIIEDFHIATSRARSIVASLPAALVA
jgi:hypothetical protein